MSDRGKECWIDLIDQLRSSGITFATGLTDIEVEAAEAAHGVRFPPDLKTFLQIALPVGKGFSKTGGNLMTLIWRK